MNYIIDLFTPETWEAFRTHGSGVTGFVKAHRGRAQNIKIGDFFVCYLVRLSRWCGLLEVESAFYEDATPLFKTNYDPWIIRFKVKPLVVLEPEHALPIRLPEIWGGLTRTKLIEQNSRAWAGRAALQSSLARLTQEDGDLLTSLLTAQSATQKEFPFSESDLRALRGTSETVKASSGVVTVVVPETSENDVPDEPHLQIEVRESIQKQALLAEIGSGWVIQPGFQDPTGSVFKHFFLLRQKRVYSTLCQSITTKSHFARWRILTSSGCSDPC